NVIISLGPNCFALQDQFCLCRGGGREHQTCGACQQCDDSRNSAGACLGSSASQSETQIQSQYRPAIRRFDWELWPGACGPLTTPPTCSIDALAYRNERGRQDRLYASCFLRSKRGKQMPGDDSASVRR